MTATRRFSILGIVWLGAVACAPHKTRAPRFTYPLARVGPTVDDYHGTQVADPYRWLEDPDSEETREWVKAQNKVTYAYLNGLKGRKKLRARLTELWNYERFGIPWKEGGRYFISRNDGLQNQSVTYWMDRLEDTPRVLIDPNTLSTDGTVALSGMSVSKNGKLLAYGVSESGSDWQSWRVREIDTGRDLDDKLDWIKFSGASWTDDNQGFFYSRYDEPGREGGKFQDVNYFQKLYYHRVGQPQAEDELVYERKDHKEWGFNGHVTEDGSYLIIYVRVGTSPKNGVFYKELRPREGETEDETETEAESETKTTELLADFDAHYGFIGNDGPVFWFRTDLDAPRSRVIAIDIRHPDRKSWREIIPERRETLRGVDVVGNQFLADYLEDARSHMRAYSLKGEFLRDVPLPGIGSVRGFGGKRGDTETFYSFTSFTQPKAVYRYDVNTGESTPFRLPKVKFDPLDYVTRQVFYKSKDGTRVPMFLTHRKDLSITGDNPTYLYGYGGFNIAITPSFSVANLVWLEMGGILAVPNLRGGGEYGEDWHQAGTKLDKQNVFDDFIAAAEYLIENSYTKSERLAIGGRSNGGLLVGAAMTQRPDLFGAALPGVGVMDMLRFHKFTIGWAWVSDYGSSDDPKEFKALHAYSPVHNLEPGTSYPATMVYTADHDDRVVPGHSFKFAATLQAAHKGEAPVLIRIDTKAGHGAGKPTTKRIEEWTDLWAFLSENLGMNRGS